MKLGSFSARMEDASQPCGDVMMMMIAQTAVMRRIVVSSPESLMMPFFFFFVAHCILNTPAVMYVTNTKSPKHFNVKDL